MLEIFQRDIAQGRLMGGGQDHRWSFPRLQGFFPAQGTETPAVPGLETGESELGSWCAQVIASGFGELEKILGDLGTDYMGALVLGTGNTGAGPVVSGFGGYAARQEVFAKDVLSGGI